MSNSRPDTAVDEKAAAVMTTTPSLDSETISRPDTAIHDPASGPPPLLADEKAEAVAAAAAATGENTAKRKSWFQRRKAGKAGKEVTDEKDTTVQAPVAEQPKEVSLVSLFRRVRLRL